MLAYVGACLDPAFNLALEEHLLSTLPADHPGWFLLWQNGPSVIVGRHQCTVDEVNLPFVNEHRIPVVRRMTGGGAVYHDTGNLNFSIITRTLSRAEGKLDFAHYLAPIVRALATVGVTAHISGRNDLEVDGRKISGSGQRVTQGRVLHHGTLLVRLDVDTMVAALTPDAAKIRAKGVASVRARVTNIADHWRPGTTLAEVQDALVATCAEGTDAPTAADFAAAEALANSKYRQWSWNFGASPPYSEERQERFPWGTVRVRCDVQRGHIRHCRIEGDFFAVRDIAELETRLVGCSCQPDALTRALAGVPWQEHFGGCDAQAMRDFFLQSV